MSYIDRERAEKELLNAMVMTGYQSRALDVIRYLPTEDVAPIKHGYWIRHGDGSVTCSVCGRRLSDVVYGYPYSVCCGSRMDLESGEGNGQ